MDAHLLRLLTEKCAASAKQSAKLVCNLARRRELDMHTLVNQFQKLLPKHQLDEINNWDDAERAITKIYFILESEVVAQNFSDANA